MLNVLSLPTLATLASQHSSLSTSLPSQAHTLKVFGPGSLTMTLTPEEAPKSLSLVDEVSIPNPKDLFGLSEQEANIISNTNTT